MLIYRGYPPRWVWPGPGPSQAPSRAASANCPALSFPAGLRAAPPKPRGRTGTRGQGSSVPLCDAILLTSRDAGPCVPPRPPTAPTPGTVRHRVRRPAGATGAAGWGGRMAGAWRAMRRAVHPPDPDRPAPAPGLAWAVGREGECGATLHRRAGPAGPDHLPTDSSPPCDARSGVARFSWATPAAH